MTGSTDLSFILIPVISVVSLISFITDLWKGRIYNWVTFPFIILGLVYSTLAGGPMGFLLGLFGILTAFLLFGWMFILGIMGGGDVKLLMVFGAWCGWKFTFEVALLSIFVGGIMAAGILIFKGNLGLFGKRIYRFLVSILVRELEPEWPKIDHANKMPFGVAIAVAAVITAFFHPLLGFLGGT